MDEDQTHTQIRGLTAEIVSCYVANNSVRSDDLPQLIAAIYDALTNLGQSQVRIDAIAEPLSKPVSIRKSINDDYLISMEDGKHYKSLKRHLKKHGLTPADYRTKWELPSDYPMVALSYSQRRSTLAKSFGLGQIRSRTGDVGKLGSNAGAKSRRDLTKKTSAD